MTLFLKNTPENIQKAASILRQGGLVAFGTETVYGLGADATNTHAVQNIYQAKGRPNFNPLIIHFADLDSVLKYVEHTENIQKLAEKFWPGPLTLILRKRPDCSISPIATAHLSTIAVRIPRNETAQQLIRKSKRPIAAPSANISGRISPSNAKHVFEELNGKIDAILDSGPCQVGVESTILDLSGSTAKILRPGGIPIEALRPICSSIQYESPIEAKIIAPGQLSSHYAPILPVRLDCQQLLPHEALLAFGPPLQNAPLNRNLSPNANLEEAARNLFASLRFLDTKGRAMGLKGIAVMPIPNHGIGQAICDRLQRAAAPRS